MQRAEALAQRQQVGERLAGVLQLAERVDDGHLGPLGKLVDSLVREGADGDPVRHARQHAGHVTHRLARARAHLLRPEVDGAPTEAVHGDLERDARAQRGLLEHEREHLPGQLRPAPITLDRERGVDELVELVGREVEHGAEVTGRHGWGLRCFVDYLVCCGAARLV